VFWGGPRRLPFPPMVGSKGEDPKHREVLSIYVNKLIK